MEDIYAEVAQQEIALRKVGDKPTYYRWRLQKMRELRKSLYTLQEIGDLFGVTRERVRQLAGGFSVATLRRLKREQIIREEGLALQEAVSRWGISSGYAQEMGAKSARTLASAGSSVGKGQRYERWVASQIQDRFSVQAELMPNHHPFDILVDNNIRVDVKSREVTYTLRNDKGGESPDTWLYNLGRKKHQERCDFFVCVMGKYKEVLVLPSALVGTRQCIGYKHPKDKVMSTPNQWDDYLNNWNVIKVALQQ